MLTNGQAEAKKIELWVVEGGGEREIEREEEREGGKRDR